MNKGYLHCEADYHFTHFLSLLTTPAISTKREKKDKVATAYYPAMTDGQRVSKYMDKAWNKI